MVLWAEHRTRPSSVSFGGTNRAVASADGTAASRFEARDNRPVAPDTRSGNVAGTGNSDLPDFPELEGPITKSF